MTPESIECPNCGRANPPWAQVCRNCGFALWSSTPANPEPSGPFPTDQASLLSMGGAVGAIVIAVLLGFVFSSMNPTPPLAHSSASATPSPTAVPSITPTATSGASAQASASASPKLLATITFGSGFNHQTRTVVNPTTTFGPNGYFAHSVSSSEAFGVSSLVEEVVRIVNGKEAVVQSRTAQGSQVSVSPTAKIFGFIVKTSDLLAEWHGGGHFVMRIWRGNEKLAEGAFTLTT